MSERADLVESLDRHRYFLHNSMFGLSDERAMTECSDTFRLCADSSVQGQLADYGAAASSTDELVRTSPDLDAARLTRPHRITF